MAKETKTASECMFKYNTGNKCDREVQGRGLCNTHYQLALKTIAKSKAGKLKNAAGKQIKIDWDVLVKAGRALEANRSVAQNYFLVD